VAEPSELPPDLVEVDVEEPERVEVDDERVEVLSRLTVEVRPDASVVLTVVRVVPLLLTRLSTVVLGTRLGAGVVAVPLALVPVLVEVAVVVVVVAVLPLLLLVEPEVEAEVELEVEEVEPKRDETVVEAAGLVSVFVSVLVSDLAEAFATSERSWPALRTDTPPVEEGVTVTRFSNDSFGCCVA